MHRGSAQVAGHGFSQAVIVLLLSSVAVISIPQSALESTTAHSAASCGGATPNCLVVLNAASCVSATFCVAVGSSGNAIDSESTTLVERFNGSTWSIVPTPSVPNVPSEFFGVSCVSVRFCVAVGDDYSAEETFTRTLTEVFNGLRWTIVPSPNSRLGYSSLSSVSCVSPTFCVGAGHAQNQDDSSQVAFLEDYVKGSWEVANAPPPPRSYTQASLESVACGSARWCTTVGNAYNKAGTKSVLLIESYSNGRWSVTPGPHFSQTHNTLCIRFRRNDQNDVSFLDPRRPKQLPVRWTILVIEIDMSAESFFPQEIREHQY